MLGKEAYQQQHGFASFHVRTATAATTTILIALLQLTLRFLRRRG